MTAQDAFLRPRLRARYRFSQGTFAGVQGNGRDAPKPDLSGRAREPRGSLRVISPHSPDKGAILTALATVLR
jgi:hypothetical protein